MSQPQPRGLPQHAAHPGNAAERYAQADRVIQREIKQLRVSVERRKTIIAGAHRRRRGDR